MCIILTKPKGIKAPSWDSITNSCTRNPDGFAVAWFKEGMSEPEIKRTLNKKEFLDYMKPIHEQGENVSWILHARIKSAGSVKLENCHCWRDEKTGLVFCHNGTLTLKPHGDMTDSETFFRYLYVPAVLGGGSADAVVEAVIGSSKFAFMKKDGSIVTHGTYVTDPEFPGVQFSNSTYKAYTATKTKAYTGSYYAGSGYNGSYYSGDYGPDDYDPYSWDDYGYGDSEEDIPGSGVPAVSEPRRVKVATGGTKLLLAHHGWHFFRPNSKSAAPTK